MVEPLRGQTGHVFPAGAGEAAGLIRALDASRSPLGPPDSWPPALRNTVALMLPTPTQIVLFWGQDYVALYNDAYAPTIGDKHPRAMGRPARENWTELWDDLEPLLAQVRETGEAVHARDRPFYLERNGSSGEQVYFDISYSPVMLEEGGIGGVLCIVNETTARVVAEQATVAQNERLARMFEQAPSFMAMVSGPDHVFTLANQAYQGMVGRVDLGAPMRDVLPYQEIGRFTALLDQVYHTGEPFVGRGVAIDLSHREDTADELFLDFVFQPLRGAEGQLTGVFIEGNDVTDAVTARRALQESEERLLLATDAGGVGIWDYDPRTGKLQWDRRTRTLFGVWHEDPVQLDRDFFDRIHDEDRPRVRGAVVRALQHDHALYDVEFRTVDIDETGSPRWLAAKGQTVFDGKDAIRFVGTIVDITSRKRDGEALTQSEAALREERGALEILNDTAAQVAAELDLDRLVQRVVDAGRILSGAGFGAFFYNKVDEDGQSYTHYTLSGVDAAHFEKFPLPRNTAIFAPTFDGTGIVRSADITKDPRYGLNVPHKGMPIGHLPVCSYLAVPVISRSGEVIGGLFFGHSEADRFDTRGEQLVTGLAAQAAIGIDNARLFDAARRANEALAAKVAERTQQRDRIWRVSRDLLGVTDANGIWLSVNPAWTRVLGWREDEIIGKRSDYLVHPDDRPQAYAHFSELFRGESNEPIELRMRMRNGDYRCLSWAAVLAEGQLYTAARDITLEKIRQEALDAAEEALRQSQKMETLGQLTGGVAHDFNNLLQIVTGNLETLARNLPQDSPRLRRAADNAMTGAMRAATLTQRLLAFARRQPLVPKPIEPNKLVAGMSELVQRTLGETVEIETVLAGGLWRVEADPNQLETAILNLAINARDAMAQGGKLTIETSNAHLDHGYAEDNVGVPAGQYVAISVSDTGSGMDEEVLTHAFEPFFTTKDVGRGTGLGLSMVYGFVKQSGGNVKIYSEPDHGTTVKIYLPRLHGPMAPREDEEKREPIVPEGSHEETILVCEDDADVRAYSVEVLRELGYRVIEAEDGRSALALLEQEKGEVALLFTDVVLPGGMTGADLAERAKALRPHMKLLYTTGYARNAIVHHGRLDPGVELITKPFTYADLAARVRDLLDR